MIHDGSEIDVNPRRRIVTLGLRDVTMIELTAVRSIEPGGGVCAVTLPTVVKVNESTRACLKRVAVRLSEPPTDGTNVEPGSLRTKFELVGMFGTLSGVCPASETA